jgi:hypothetical protein
MSSTARGIQDRELWLRAVSRRLVIAVGVSLAGFDPLRAGIHAAGVLKVEIHPAGVLKILIRQPRVTLLITPVRRWGLRLCVAETLIGKFQGDMSPGPIGLLDGSGTETGQLSRRPATTAIARKAKYRRFTD